MLFTDAAFANADGYASQIGFVLVLADKHHRANIIHYGSQKSRRFTRSVMAAELLALTCGYDHEFVASQTLEEILQVRLPIEAYVDSRTGFNCIATNSNTAEKRLQIDAFSVRQALNNGELARFDGLMVPAIL